MNKVEWVDFFGKQNVLIEGEGDVVFHVIPLERNADGDSKTSLLSKKAILELARKIEAKYE